jgi:tetratricopeptide (TPR) repeat protein
VEEAREQAEAALQKALHLPSSTTEARQAFRRAAELFEDLRRHGAENAGLFRNLGNAYLLAGELPQAILAYRRGLRLAPSDPVLRAGLAFARTRVVHMATGNFGRPREESLPHWLPRLASPWLVGSLLVFYSINWLAFTRWRMIGASWLLESSIVLFVIVTLLAGAVAYEEWRQRDEREHPLAVIADDGVLLRKGNGLSYARRYDTPVNRGVEARLLHARGAWLQIELGGGEVGWVPRRFVLLDSLPEYGTMVE